VYLLLNNIMGGVCTKDEAANVVGGRPVAKPKDKLETAQTVEQMHVVPRDTLCKNAKICAELEVVKDL
jgi:hypothetical protein